jgi:transposase
MNNNVIGLDRAKHIFHTFTVDADGKSIKKKFKRDELLIHFANCPSSVIGIEACGSAHHWARELTKLGHEVILLNAKYVKNFVVGNKNDYNDAAAIHDAVSRPNKRVVAVKSIAQQDIQMVHNLRKELVDKRTALVNQTRGLLGERGIIINQGINQVRTQLPLILEDAENGLSTLARELLAEQYDTLKALDADIKAHDQRISRLCNANNLSKRFLNVPGIGPITATIVAADLGENGKGYESSRDYAASLGVVPRQHSSGGKQVYLGISKRGNRYIRTLLIHGARSVLKNGKKKNDPLSLWLQSLIERRGFNKAAVALANKNARILWAMATQQKEYLAA